MREWTVLVEAMAPDEDELVEPEPFDADEVVIELAPPPDVVAAVLMDRLANYGASAAADPTSWSVQFSLEAESSREAADHGHEVVSKAVVAAGLPDWPIVRVEAVWSDVVDREQLTSPLPQLLGTQEVAAALGVSRQRLHELRSSGRFPEPVAELAATPLWLRSAIDAFIELWDRRPGRRAAADVPSAPA